MFFFLPFPTRVSVNSCSPRSLTCAPPAALPGEGAGLRRQHVPRLLAGRPRPARISAQLPLKRLPHAGVREEPVGAGDRQRKEAMTRLTHPLPFFYFLFLFF